MNKIVLTAVLAFLAIASHAANASEPTLRIEGVWTKEVTLRNCATGEVAPVPNPIFPAINTFHAGGTMTEHGARFSPATRNNGQGIWKRTGPRTFAARTLWHLFDANGFFSGTFEVRSTHRIAPNNRSISTNATFTVSDVNGVVLVNGCATEVGQRVRL